MLKFGPIAGFRRRSAISRSFAGFKKKFFFLVQVFSGEIKTANGTNTLLSPSFFLFHSNFFKHFFFDFFVVFFPSFIFSCCTNNLSEFQGQPPGSSIGLYWTFDCVLHFHPHFLVGTEFVFFLNFLYRVFISFPFSARPAISCCVGRVSRPWLVLVFFIFHFFKNFFGTSSTNHFLFRAPSRLSLALSSIFFCFVFFFGSRLFKVVHRRFLLFFVLFFFFKKTSCNVVWYLVDIFSFFVSRNERPFLYSFFVFTSGTALDSLVPECSTVRLPRC